MNALRSLSNPSMRRVSRCTAGCCGVLACGLVAWLPGRVESKSRVRAGAPAFAGYRSWTRVNPRPVRFQSVAAQTACAPAAPARRPGRDPDPHAERFLSVYVNARGRDAMLTQSNPQFPVGSVIVKEKLPDARSRRPELLTVMVKRRPGYNAANGDWEYLVTDGAARVTARGKLENCASCHASERSTDFVFRNYLPDGAKLR